MRYRARRYLIVNADDFNLTEGVNRGIITSHKEGLVSSTTVFVNFPFNHLWVKTLRAVKRLGVGLHLNVVIGNPVSPRDEAKALLNEKGEFRWRSGEIKRPFPLEEIHREFDVQIKLFKKTFSRFPTHLDTHYHIHKEKEIFAIILDLSHKYRLPFRLSPFLSEEERQRLRRRGIILAHRLLGDTSFQSYWTRKKLEDTIKDLPAGISELMVHPGYADKPLAKVSSLTKQRALELRLLCSERLLSLVKKNGIHITHYGNLKRW
ncbi:MAG: ChbG/HpnK family deacetylase [Candidatus Omnitrophica bacterium]|nr:ChbG/HpnK family deacetylase [Candidatus Omnitrophota bacterium]